MKILLIPFSFLYYAVISIGNFFYKIGVFRSHRLAAKVISVGNITWGGTGKTPAVAFIANILFGRGLKPAILLRGYGGDEELLYSKLAPAIPVVPGKNRVETGRAIVASRLVKTVLLDDGFQYRRLKRDLDIVCIDATDPFGNGWVIPAGSMREGIGNLKRADIFLITKVDLAQDKNRLKELEGRLRKINPAATILKSSHIPQYFYRLSDDKIINGAKLKNNSIALVSAIGNPGAFERTILSLGLKFKKHFIFRDHHWYKESDLKKIENYCSKNGIDTIVTTEKDAVRLSRIPYPVSRIPVLALRVQLEITDNEQGFYNRLSGICAG
ncbi:tetraacyldisaccharide 4'-kinase [Candidatus Omnitrophota bacterium]